MQSHNSPERFWSDPQTYEAVLGVARPARSARRKHLRQRLLRDHVWGSASYATRIAAGSSPGRSAPCPHWKLLKINVSESMLSPSLPMSLDARRSPSGRAHSEPARRTKDWKIAAVKTQSMYCIALRNKFDKTIIGWYDASASNFSTDQRRAKHFFDRVDADLVADQLRRMYPRLAQDIEVTAVQPTGLTCSSDAVAVLL